MGIFGAFLIKHWRGLALVAILIAAWGALTYWGHAKQVSGEAAGEAKIQALWRADTAARDKAAADAIAVAQANTEAVKTAGKVIADEYAKKVASATTERDRYFRLLQSASSEVCPIAAAESAGTDDAPGAGATSVAGQIDSAAADAIAEARLNAEQLDALIAVVRPQL